MSSLRDGACRVAPGGPGLRQTGPRLLPGEVDDLITHVLRCRPVYQEAKRWLKPEHFHGGEELHFQVTVNLFFDLVTRRYHDCNVPYKALYNAACQWVSQNEGLDDKIKAALLAKPDDVDTTDSDDDLPVGIIWHAYRVVTEQDLDVRFGLDLLKRFLMEREAYDKAMAAMAKGKGGPGEGFGDVLERSSTRTRQIESIGTAPARALGEEWAEHLRRLEAHRGRRLIGLETGLRPLDERTLGLRGLFVLGAMPNVGKTALAVQLGVGVCRHHANNDAVVVIVSLDMDRWELYRRVHCHLAQMDWATLLFGSQELRGRPEGPYLNAGHECCLADADRLLAEYQIDRRLVIYDRETIGQGTTAARLVSLLADAKARAGATRALLVVDYLQLLDVPEKLAERGDELEAAKHRIRALQDVVRATRTVSNPEGDTVLAISEARKPADAKTGWGNQLADLMGSSRVAYAADAVVLYRRMGVKDIVKFYRSLVQDEDAQARRRLEEFEGNGVAPVVLTIAKARDGMVRGEFGLEFDFRRSTFHTIEPPTAVDGIRSSAANGALRQPVGPRPTRVGG